MTGRARRTAATVVLAAGLGPWWASGPRAGEVEAARRTALLQTKCTRCHDLTRVLDPVRTRGEWEEVLQRMAGKEGVELTAEDLALLRQTHLERQRRLFAENLFASRCSRCHALDRAHAAVTYPPERWRKVINYMRGLAAGWVTQEEAAFLIRWHREERARAAASPEKGSSGK
ncbi:MAG: hypothetical protein Kow0092_35480 [Deferrisomatales bacterium]